MKYLQLGDYGRDVEVWQRFLAQIWLLELDRALPGSFDEPTHNATRAYQEECGLEPTGIVDRETQERARDRGLAMVDDRVFKGVTIGKVIVGITMFIFVILLAQCMIVPDSGRNMEGVRLPLNPATVPGSAPVRQ